MESLPRWLRWTHVAFNVSVLVSGLFGIAFIWRPTESFVFLKLFGSVLVVLLVATFILAGYRTVYSDPRANG